MVTQPIPISVTVNSPTVVGLNVGVPNTVSVVVTSPTTVSSIVNVPSVINVSIDTPSVINIEISEPEIIDVEVVEGMNTEERELLYSLAERELDRDYRKIWENVKIEDSSALDGTAGDAVPFSLSTTYQPVSWGIVKQDEWRDSGWLLIKANVEVTDPSGSGSGTVYFSIESAPDFDTGIASDEVTRGLVPSYTQHLELSINTSFGVLPSSHVVTLWCVVQAFGNTNGVWRQYATGFIQSRGGGVVGITIIDSDFSPSFDPTDLRHLRMQCKFVPDTVETASTLATSCGIFNPRSGSGN